MRRTISVILAGFLFLLGCNANAATLDICSFNIQFLGHFKNRDDEALAALVKDFDIVVVQELVAPPMKGQYPDGTTFKSDVEAQFGTLRSPIFESALWRNHGRA